MSVRSAMGVVHERDGVRQRAFEGRRWVEELPRSSEVREVAMCAAEALLELALAGDASCLDSRQGYLVLAKRALGDAVERIDALLAAGRSGAVVATDVVTEIIAPRPPPRPARGRLPSGASDGNAAGRMRRAAARPVAR
jgi:hypothetical protein